MLSFRKKEDVAAIWNKPEGAKKILESYGLYTKFVEASWPETGKKTYVVYESTKSIDGSETGPLVRVLVYKGAPFAINLKEVPGINWTLELYSQYVRYSPASGEEYSYFLCLLPDESGNQMIFPELLAGKKGDYEFEMCYPEYLALVEERLKLQDVPLEFQKEESRVMASVIEEESSYLETDQLDADGFMKKFQSKRADASGKITTFMNKEGKYSMYDYVSVIRNNCTEKEWLLLKPFLNLDEEVCNVLGDLNTRFNLFEMLLESNREFTAQAEVVTRVGAKENASTIQSYTPVDHIQSRFTQSANHDELFFQPNRYVRKGEMCAWAHLFDHSQKIYYGADPAYFVPHARTLAEMTKCFKSWVKGEDESYEELVPKTPYLGCDYTPDDFRFLADIAISVKKGSKGEIRIIWNTKGGAQFSEKDQLVAYFKVGPMGRLMGEGIPGVFKLYYAYQTDKAFQEHWDNFVKTSVKKRQENANTKIYGNWVSAAEDFHGLFGSTARRSLFMTESMNEPATKDEFRDMVNALHDANRSMVETMSVDKSAFMKLIYQTNLFGSELLPITIINDLLFRGTDAELRYAKDLVSAVYVRRSDGYARPKCYPKDKITFEKDYDDKFDRKSNGVNSIIDLTDAKNQKIYIGGGDWIEKITPKELGKDGRAILYYDYEPKSSKMSGNELIHYPVKLEQDIQYKHASEVLSALKSKDGPHKVGVITSMRSMPRILEDYNVEFIYPAPYPMTLSVYVVATKEEPFNRVTLDQARDLALMQLRKMRYIIEIYMYGAADACDLVDKQLFLSHSPSMSKVFMSWWCLLRSRYVKEDVEHQGTSDKRISRGLSKMLRIDQNVKNKIVIKSMGARLDTELNRVTPRRKKN